MTDEKKKFPLDGLLPTLDSITEHLTNHDMTERIFPDDIQDQVVLSAKQNDVTPDTIIFCMLPILATACGMHTFMHAGSRDMKSKPNIFAVNILNSGAGKTPISKGLIDNTLKLLDKQMLARNEQQLESVQINKTDGPIFNATDRKDAMSKISLMRHNVLMSKGSIEAIFHFAGNGASMLYFDEMANFWRQFDGQERLVQDLTELYQTHSINKVLIGRTNTSVEDSSLNAYIHGTPEYGKLFMSPDMRSDGSCWRFCINVYTPEKLDVSFDDFLSTRVKTHPDFSRFFSLFDEIRKQHFERTDDWVYKYDDAALELKQHLDNRLIWCSKSIDNELMSTMLSKLLGIVDKAALLHSIVKSNTSEAISEDFLVSSYMSKVVGIDSVEFGWDFAKKVWTGWMTVFQLAESNAEDEESLQKASVKKKTRSMTDYNDVVKSMGGPGTYDIKVWENALRVYPYSGVVNTRRCKTNVLQMMSKHPGCASIVNDKIILKYV